jgi:hypothetical protein
MSDMEQLIQTMAALNETIKNHKTDPATLDMPALEATMRRVMTDMSLLNRSVPTGDMVGPEGFRSIDPVIKDGRFAGLRQSDLQFTAIFLQRAAKMGLGRVTLPSEALLKAAMNTTDATGGDLVPTGMAAQLWSDFFTASRVVSTFGPPIAMPSDPFNLPFNLGAITFGKGTQNSAKTAQAPATDQSVMTTTEQVAEVNWSYTLDEDAVIAMLPSLRAALALYGAEYMDAFVLNADSASGSTGNINLDDSTPDAGDYYMSAGQLGIRHLWIGDAAGQGVNAGGDALEDGDIVSALALMGKYAVNPTRCVIFCDISTYLKGLLNLDGVLTMDKYGAKAVLQTGELASYRGVPIVPSASHPLTEADGKCANSAGSNTLGSISLVNVDQWKVGFRRQLLIEVDKSIQTRTFILVASYRIAVACGVTSTRSAVKHTAGIYNILVA